MMPTSSRMQSLSLTPSWFDRATTSIAPEWAPMMVQVTFGNVGLLEVFIVMTVKQEILPSALAEPNWQQSV